MESVWTFKAFRTLNNQNYLGIFSETWNGFHLNDRSHSPLCGNVCRLPNFCFQQHVEKGAGLYGRHNLHRTDHKQNNALDCWLKIYGFFRFKILFFRFKFLLIKTASRANRSLWLRSRICFRTALEETWFLNGRLILVILFSSVYFSPMLTKGRDTRCDKSLRHVAATGCCNKSPRVTCENHCRCDRISSLRSVAQIQTGLNSCDKSQRQTKRKRLVAAASTDQATCVSRP